MIGRHSLASSQGYLDLPPAAGSPACGKVLRVTILPWPRPSFVLGAPAAAGAQPAGVPVRAWHEALADAAARRAGIDRLLLPALIEVEVAWRPDAVSIDGAVGLMQILPSTAGDYVESPNLADPAVDLAIGVVHLRGLIDRHGVVRAPSQPGRR